MIAVTPLEGLTVLLDVDLIEAIEAHTPTIVVLAGDRRMVVTESPAELLSRIERVRATRLGAAADPSINGSARVIALSDPVEDDRRGEASS